MRNKRVNKEINKLIAEYFFLEKGCHISYPYMKVCIEDDIFISRKALKHIVEARKDDDYGIARIQDMFLKIPETIHEPDLVIPNWNKKYQRSIISGKLYLEIREALLVIQDTNGEIIDVINAFFRRRDKFEKLRATFQ